MTDQPTDHATRSATIGCIYILIRSTAVPPNNYNHSIFLSCLLVVDNIRGGVILSDIVGQIKKVGVLSLDIPSSSVMLCVCVLQRLMPFVRQPQTCQPLSRRPAGCRSWKLVLWWQTRRSVCTGTSCVPFARNCA